MGRLNFTPLILCLLYICLVYLLKNMPINPETLCMLAQVPLFIWPMALTIGAQRLSYKTRGKGTYVQMGSRSICQNTSHYEPPSWL